MKPALPPADLLPVRPEATPAFRVVRVLIEPLLYLLFDVRVEGREHIPRSRNVIIIANHLGWLDAFLILSAFPNEPRVHYLGNPTVLATRKLQWLVVRSVGGYVPVNPAMHGDARLFTHVNVCLERGGSVALFPEGTTDGTAEGRLLPFKKGFAHWAIDNQVPVVPVGLSGVKDLWLRKTVSVRIGEAISPEGHTVESLVQAGQAAVAALLRPVPDARGPRLLRRRLTHLF